jgi:hypothetical protein
MNFFSKQYFGIGVIILFASFFICLPVRAVSVDTDTDNDGLSDAIEVKLGTDINNPDTDGDGYADELEVQNGYSPLEGKGSRNIKRSGEVDLTYQKFYYLANGVRVGTLLASTGRPGMSTPVGNYKILKKVPTKTYRTATVSYPNTKWNLLFEAKVGLYLHGAYWHNEFGIRPRSGGCVNLKTSDAEKMYKFFDIGDKIKVSGKTPTGKVVAVKK